MRKKLFYILVLSFTFSLYSCTEDFTPKPSGYFRIDFPMKEYVEYDTTKPFTFEYPKYTNITNEKNDFWININYPNYKGRIYLTYAPIKNNLKKHLDDNYELVYKYHTMKADAINDTAIYLPKKKVYGVVYEIKGDAASSIQFYLTDSTSNFFRGALYFDVAPNKDSLAPVIGFIGTDIQHLINTFEWKNIN